MHTFLNPRQIVALGVGELQRQALLGGYFTRLGVSNFPYQNGVGRSVDFLLPTPLAGREYELDTRTNPVVFDELTERVGSIVIDKHFYSAVAVTDEQLRWDIGNFASRVLNPQIKAVADKCESRIGTVVQSEATTYALGTVNYAPGSNPFAAAVAARGKLNAAGVPAGGRIWLVGSDVETDMLTSGELTNTTTTGDTSAFRDAEVGRIAGFTVVSSSEVDPNFSTFVHPSAIGIVNVAPVVPEGAKAGASADYNGFSTRWIRDYDPNFLRDRSIVSTFFGAQGIRDHQNADGTLSGKNARLVKVTRTAS